MTDIFVSYSSSDKDRVAPVCEHLSALGYDVFWDQKVPAGCDWDSWIRQELMKSKCAVVFWSQNSVGSNNVRHEATVAQKLSKLIPVLIDRLTPDQFPMGLYNVQAANLIGWAGDYDNVGWNKLAAEVEASVKPHAPLWLQDMMHSLEANLLAERARVQAAESRVRSLEAKIGGDASAVLEREREVKRASDEVFDLKQRLEQEAKTRQALVDQGKALEQRLEEAGKERQALADRLKVVVKGGKAKVPGSRGHIGFIDLLAWAAAVGGLAFLAQADPIDVKVNSIASIGAAIGGGWAFLILLRLLMRRRITELPIDTVPNTQAGLTTASVASTNASAGFQSQSNMAAMMNSPITAPPTALETNMYALGKRARWFGRR